MEVAQSCPTLCDPMDLYSPWDSPGQKCLVTNSASLGKGSTNPIPEPRGLKPPVLWRPLATHRCGVNSRLSPLPRFSAWGPLGALSTFQADAVPPLPQKCKQASSGGLGSVGKGSSFGQYALTLRRWISRMNLKYCVFLPVFARRNNPECSVLAGPLADSSLWTSGAQESPSPLSWQRPSLLGREAPSQEAWASPRDPDAWDHHGAWEGGESESWAPGLHQLCDLESFPDHSVPGFPSRT